ncbi:uncharacterized protein LOC112270108 [Brachypodium distachyon]|uniref:uncharacterized protein LOC112270108 n=1 Tax=Brachypodium distachyon TaxID=15368 RepID=UPI000D0D432D|nr:uncharacterized protein LOC112270108 [Brachypodium distachyon]|eukprot:XP_024313570.1 uncharacterized protein LOC112270108 [Brachypodium distachyon]
MSTGGHSPQSGDVVLRMDLPTSFTGGTPRAPGMPVASDETLVTINSDGWQKRVRVPAGAMERESIPGRTTALEESVKNFAERRCQFVVYPGIGMPSADSTSTGKNACRRLHVAARESL